MSKFTEDQIEISEIIREVWKSKIKIIWITSFFILVSLLISFLLPNIYKSESLLSVESSSQNSMSSMLSRYAGVASLAGVSLPSNASEDKSLLAIETIKSRDFLRHLLRDEKIKINLMAYDQYIEKTSSLTIDPEIYDLEKGMWLQNSYYKYDEPTFLEVYEVYSDSLNISQDKVTGFLNLSFSHVSPYFAKSFLETIIQEANTLLKSQAILETDHSIKYLRGQLNEIAEIEIRNSINSLMKQQLEKRMLADTNKNY
ncbi:MAG: Wzz/FepE/Etk N-terminal domain-containing protein [Gammaproteobacteria bacterium]